MKPGVETVKLSVIRGRIGGMSTQTITEFLEARIAEDELAAYDLMGEREGDRTLAECAAKRAMSSLHAPKMHRGTLLVCAECGDWWDGSPIDYPCDSIKIVAAVYKDHPDYQQEWAL